MGRELARAGVRPKLDAARHDTLVTHQRALLVPAGIAALSIGAHALLPGVYWFWQALVSSALRGALWGTVGLSVLTGSGVASDYLTVVHAEAHRSPSPATGAGEASAEAEPTARAWAAKVEALVSGHEERALKPEPTAEQAEGPPRPPSVVTDPGLSWLLSKDFRQGWRAARTYAERARAAAAPAGEAAAPGRTPNYRAENAPRLVGRAVGFGFLGIAALDAATIAFVLVAPIHWYVGFAMAKSAVLGSAFVAMSLRAGRARREYEAAATILASEDLAIKDLPNGEQRSREEGLSEQDQAELRAWAQTRVAPRPERATLLEKLGAWYAKLVTKNDADAAQLRELMKLSSP
ncbi:MAG: hypothetical protein IPL40_08975 [Proteobacteria bacterium]|nr:hypothetical protein [Pseudomonadota bacterium]